MTATGRTLKFLHMMPNVSAMPRFLFAALESFYITQTKLQLLSAEGLHAFLLLLLSFLHVFIEPLQNSQGSSCLVNESKKQACWILSWFAGSVASLGQENPTKNVGFAAGHGGRCKRLPCKRTWFNVLAADALCRYVHRSCLRICAYMCIIYTCTLTCICLSVCLSVRVEKRRRGLIRPILGPICFTTLGILNRSVQVRATAVEVFTESVLLEKLVRMPEPRMEKHTLLTRSPNSTEDSCCSCTAGK